MKTKKGMTLGEFLKARRVHAGLSVNDVAAISKGRIDKTTISRLEGDGRGLSLKGFFVLADIYEIPLDDFRKACGGKKVASPRKNSLGLKRSERRLILALRGLPASARNNFLQLANLIAEQRGKG